MAASLAALVFAILVFVVWPALDLDVASRFALGGGRFVGQTTPGNALRQIFYWTPLLLYLAMLILYGLRRLAGLLVWAPTGAGVLFMTLSLALGPGLIVNLLLKDHSHRPRPYQVQQFGGDETFRPFWRFDGACQRNCSFVSGESSAAFWTLAPALLAPPPWRAVAIAAALVFGTATSLLRLAFGGHFLSDTVLAALLTWLVIVGCWRLVVHRAGDPRVGSKSPDDPL